MKPPAGKTTTKNPTKQINTTTDVTAQLWPDCHLVFFLLRFASGLYYPVQHVWQKDQVGPEQKESLDEINQSKPEWCITGV